MEHADPEALALVALGEPLTDAAVLEHLADCASCRHEVDALRSTISVARSTVGESALQAPPARVWQGVRGQLGLPSDLEPVMPTLVPGAAILAAEPAAPSTAPEVVRLDAVRERRASIRRLLVPVAASAAAAALVAGGVLAWGAAAPRDAGLQIATAQLDALPAWSGASGQATVAELADGERVVRVSLDAAVDEGVAREVWLLTEGIDGLISLGYLTGASGEFIVPASVDLAEFSVVDISAEPLDGDPTHSGDSIVRGALDS
ncbi:anti-sigma factor [Microcella sp.]|uniref:anti-sigma factor n=1 Tax=Microcella sp. TaxID=1913979 RepID=UPI00391D09BF